MDNEYFEIVPIEIENGINDEEREILIAEELNRNILNYDPIDYIEKEINIEKKGRNQTFIILLKRDEISKILEIAHDKKIQILGMIPGFLVKGNITKTEKKHLFLDIGTTRTIAIGLEEENIIDFEVIFIEKDEIKERNIDSSMFMERICNIALGENDANKIDSITIEKDKKEYAEIMDSYISENNIDLKVETIDLTDVYHIKESYNFLPIEYKQALQNKILMRRTGICASIIVIIEIMIFFVISNIERKGNEKNNKLVREVLDINKKIQEEKDKVQGLEDFKSKIEALEEQINKKNTKFVDFLVELKKLNVDNLTINKMEYGDRGKFQIKGESITDRAIYDLQDNISKASGLVVINHDFIIEKEGKYEFQMDIGVKID